MDIEAWDLGDWEDEQGEIWGFWEVVGVVGVGVWVWIGVGV